ncbi:MAG TPA: flagellar basal-body MS-ring/collar protein FliF [Anaerolineaceae bacterium]
MLSRLIQQFQNFWRRQSSSQKVIFTVLVTAGLALIATFIFWASTPTYATAYRGLSEEDAGNVVQKLQESNIAYKIQSNGTILVQSDQVYEVRMMMAREGLPKSNGVGMELFDTNSLGMTEFTQRVNYQRAVEGELERTIGSISSVGAVRVHIVTPEKRLLAQDQDPATASITIKEKPGQSLTADQVQAITHLVASAVQGLKAENVVVVDTNGNLLASGTADQQRTLSSLSDSQRAAEKAAAVEVQRKVQKLLDSVLGANRSVVQTSVTMDWTKRETTSQTFNPTPAAIRSSQKINENYTTNSSTVGGIPGAGSNLPTIVPTTTAGGQGMVYQRTEEITNYEITKTDLKEIESPGKVSKMSVSVLVDGVTDQAQLDTIRAAVSAAAGIDEARGDTLVVDTMAFDRTAVTAMETELQTAQQTELYTRIGIAVGASLLALFLLWYISRLFRNLRLASSDLWMTVMKPVTQAALEAPAEAPMIGLGPGISMIGAPTQAQEAAPAAMPAAFTPQAPSIPFELPPLPTSPAISPEEEQMTKVVSRLTEENPATVAEIIQLWLSEDEK